VLNIIPLSLSLAQWCVLFALLASLGAILYGLRFRSGRIVLSTGWFYGYKYFGSRQCPHGIDGSSRLYGHVPGILGRHPGRLHYRLEADGLTLQ
jgi:hypothetical protein